MCRNRQRNKRLACICTWMLDINSHTRFLSSSHPSPPAPMTRILHVSNKNPRDWEHKRVGLVNDYLYPLNKGNVISYLFVIPSLPQCLAQSQDEWMGRVFPGTSSHGSIGHPSLHYPHVLHLQPFCTQKTRCSAAHINQQSLKPLSQVWWRVKNRWLST